MTLHIRAQVRAAAVAQLTGLSTTGTRVHASRRHPLRADQLPALCIYTLSEESDVETMGDARHLSRLINLEVEAVAQDNDQLDDVLDRICGEVEAALGSEPTLGDLARDCVLTSTRIALQPQAAELKTGSAVMTFRVFCRTRTDDPIRIN